MAEKEYAYGLGPEASGIGQLASLFLPMRREVIEPPKEQFIESTEPGQMERVVTPGQYGDVELAMPQAVEAFLNFKGLARDPEARQAVMDVVSRTPELASEFVRRMGVSGQAALSGEQEVYDPQSGTAVSAA